MEGKSASVREQKVAGNAESKKTDPDPDENVEPEWANPGTPSGHGHTQTIELTAGYICDGCQTKIQIRRWHCDECPDYDLCDECYDNQDVVGVDDGTHKVDHSMTKKDINGNDGENTVLDIADLLAPPKNEGLIHKLMHFVDSAMTEWEPFFEECIDLFEQDWNELHNEGETLEQYAAFKKYEKLVEKKFNEFAGEAGFDSVGDCFEEIQRLVAEDKVKLEEELAEMRANMKRTHDEWEAKKQRAKAQAEAKSGDAGDDAGDAGGGGGGGEAKTGEGKTADGGGGGGGGESKAADAAEDLVGQAFVAGVANATKAVELPKAPGQEDSPPMFLIFHRMGLEQMVEMCCNLAEYRTFSMMMRMRVEQRRWQKMIEEMMAANAAKRDAEGGAGGGADGGDAGVGGTLLARDGDESGVLEFEILEDGDGGEGKA